MILTSIRCESCSWSAHANAATKAKIIVHEEKLARRFEAHKKEAHPEGAEADSVTVGGL